MMISLQILFKFLKKTSVNAKSRVRGRKTKPATISRQSSALPEELRRQFSVAELLAATNNFRDDLTRCKLGFGKVYKGLLHDMTLTVAVKSS
ncbi:hypothetical protein SLA2020_329770 [Shorea laevis]